MRARPRRRRRRNRETREETIERFERVSNNKWGDEVQGSSIDQNMNKTAPDAITTKDGLVS